MTTQQETPVADFLRAHELSNRWPCLGRSTWQTMVATGALPSFKIGRARLVRISDVVAFLEGHRAEVGTATCACGRTDCSMCSKKR